MPCFFQLQIYTFSGICKKNLCNGLTVSGIKFVVQKIACRAFRWLHKVAGLWLTTLCPLGLSVVFLNWRVSDTRYLLCQRPAGCL